MSQMTPKNYDTQVFPVTIRVKVVTKIIIK